MITKNSDLPVHWSVLTKPGCRPVSQCPRTEAVDRWGCSRSECTGRPCLRHWRGDRAGVATTRWPWPPPCGLCTSAPESDSPCSTQRACCRYPPDARCWWSGDHFKPHTCNEPTPLVIYTCMLHDNKCSSFLSCIYQPINIKVN